MVPESTSNAEQWLDEVLPGDLDWQGLVQSYPRISMGIATAAGFWIGLRHGPAILQAVSDFAGRTVSEQIDEFLGQER
jgi:hypothetical protein